MQQLSIKYLPLSEVAENASNARTHDRRQLRQIASSIREFGFTNPLLVDDDHVLVAGHGRLAAARLVGLEAVPVIVIAGLSDTRKRALMLADNKIALNAGWNVDLLASELHALSSIEIDFDVEITGFNAAEIDLVIEDAEGGSTEQAETVPLPEFDRPPITRLGDLWRLGSHRLICGDARNAETINRLMKGKKAAAGFTDPPYNVPINGHVSGCGKIRHGEFSHAAGEMSVEEFETFLKDSLGLAAGASRDGAVWFCCMDWRHLSEMLAAGRLAFSEFLNLCVWAKTNGGMGSLYRSQHELVFVFRKGAAQHRNNVQLGRFGRNRTNLWTYAGVNTFREGRMEELAAHPTAKPVPMIKDALLDVTKRGDLVLDPFMGAGATLIAAERSGRIAYGVEIDPAYVDVTLRRWRTETGEDPIRGNDCKNLAPIEDDRDEDLI